MEVVVVRKKKIPLKEAPKPNPKPAKTNLTPNSRSISSKASTKDSESSGGTLRDQIRRQRMMIIHNASGDDDEIL